MLTFDFKWLDVRDQVAAGVQPVAVLPRPVGAGGPYGRHWVPDLAPGAKAPWALTASGEAVRVPVWAFKTAARGPAAVWGLGVEVGVRLMADFRAHTGEAPVSVTLYLGTTTTDLYPENAERCYVGIAVRTQ